MRFAYLTALSLMALSFSACSKKNNSFSFNGNYECDTTSVVYPVKMFTESGRITDPAVIFEFVCRRGFEAGFVFDRARASISPGLLKIAISGNNVTYHSEFSNTFIQAKVVSRRNSPILIEDIDTTFIFVSKDLIRTISSPCDSLLARVQSPSIVKTYTPLSGATGYQGRISHLNKYPLIVRNEKLTMPVLSYIIKSNRNCESSVRNTRGMMDAEIEEELSKGDTIVYQIKEVALISK